MIEALCKATHNFFTHQLRTDVREEETGSFDLPFYLVSIQLTAPSKTQTASFFFTQSFMNAVSAMMLGEVATDEETVLDLVGETANLIAGSAKIVASNEEGESFSIDIPKVKGLTQTQPRGTFRAFWIENQPMLCIALN